MNPMVMPARFVDVRMSLKFIEAVILNPHLYLLHFEAYLR